VSKTYDADMRSSKFILLFAIICWANQATRAQTPNLAFRYYELGHEKIKLGDWQGAADDFTKAIELDARLQTSKHNNNSGDRFDGSEMSVGEISVSDPFTAAAYHSRAIARTYLGELEGAIEDYQHALRIKPKWAEAYLGLGFVLLDKKDFEGAVDGFSRALKLKPTLVSAHHARGTAFMKQGRMEPAIIDFTSALKLDPHMAEAYANRGLALMVLGREVEARTDLQKSLELKPELKKDLDQRIELARKLMIEAASVVSKN
jgi:tetratricopeptide (TPR) repeat protein